MIKKIIIIIYINNIYLLLNEIEEEKNNLKKLFLDYFKKNYLSSYYNHGNIPMN